MCIPVTYKEPCFEEELFLLPRLPDKRRVFLDLLAPFLVESPLSDLGILESIGSRPYTDR